MTSTVVQNWPNWVFLVSIVLLFKGTLERWYRRMRADQNRMHGFCDNTVEILDRYSKTILENQKTIMHMVAGTRRDNDDIIIAAIREMSTASNDSTGRVILELGERDKHMVAAIEALARAIRDDLTVLRNPPPAGDTGSQVRDGGKTP